MMDGCFDGMVMFVLMSCVAQLSMVTKETGNGRDCP